MHFTTFLPLCVCLCVFTCAFCHVTNDIETEKIYEILDWIESASREELREAAGGTKVSQHCFIPNGRSSCAPQLVIAGAMKCGTTSLHTYLLNHPQVLPLKEEAKINGHNVLGMKEIRYFSDPTFYSLLFNNSLEESQNQFFDIFREMPTNSYIPTISIDASPVYIVRNNLPYREKCEKPNFNYI